MGGIAGWIDYAKSNIKEEKVLDAMCESLKRSSGEKKSVFYSQNAIFMQSAGNSADNAAKQISISAKGEIFTIIFNGELYNGKEAKEELAAQKILFESNLDGEIVCRAFAEWGSGCLDKLNGTFSLAIWQHNAKILFLARDRAGVKPLFYYRTKNGLIFASELKALLKNPMIKAHIDVRGLQQILLLGPSRSPGTGCIKGVYELKPAEMLYLDKSGMKISAYWRLCAAPHEDNLSQTIDRTRELITDSVIRQIDASIPMACFLSGGLDSSIIAKIAADCYKKRNLVLSTYSVDYEENDKYFEANSYQPDSDNKYIEIMSGAIKSKHIRVELNNLEVAKAIKEAAAARDFPGMGDIDSSLLLFSKFVGQKYSLCFSGECADEIFGGYPWYHKDELLYKDSFPWSDSIELRKKLFARSYLGANPQEFVDEAYQRIIAYTDYLETDSKKDKRIREMFMLNFYYFMQTLIERSNKMTAYAGIDTRVPFCDYRLLEYAFNMPWELKALKGREKGIMREAFKDILPEQIVNRKKSPYPKTFSPELIRYVKREAAQLVSDKGSILNELINKEFFEGMSKGSTAIDKPWFGQLMREPQIFAYLIQIDAFFKNFALTII